jgi:hypothetical protein
VPLVGSAHAPDGRQATRLRVGVRVGPMEKAFDVVGDRVWQGWPHRDQCIFTEALHDDADLVRPRLRRRRPAQRDPNEHDAYLPIPLGRGRHSG